MEQVPAAMKRKQCHEKAPTSVEAFSLAGRYFLSLELHLLLNALRRNIDISQLNTLDVLFEIVARFNRHCG